MGVRATKVRALVRYLTGHTGVPMLSWDGTSTAIDAPPPYRITVTTARKLQEWHDAIREAGPLGVAIRYDNTLPSIEDAWVGMTLRTFTQFMEAHYESVRPRVQSHIEGE